MRLTPYRPRSLAPAFVSVAAATLAVTATSILASRCFAGLGTARAAPRRAAQSAERREDELRGWAPPGKLVDTVEELGGSVTKADLLARGVAASGLERDLVRLARASGATLKVNDRGEVLFDFPAKLQRVLRSRSTAARLRQMWTGAKPWLGWSSRVLFGASLLATVALLYSAVLIIMSSQTSNKENGNGRRSNVVSTDHFSMMFGQDLFFWLNPRPYGYYGCYGYGSLWGLPMRPPPKMSFLEAVFSFVFGDGNPNTQLLNEDRWQIIGEYIAQNGGSVVSEQIAPYLDPPSGSGTFDLEAAMLPVLLRFRGRPEVSDDGDIVYVFPEMQEARSAGELIVEDVQTSELKKRLEAFGRPSSAVDRSEIIADYQRVTEGLRKRNSSMPCSLQERDLQFSEAETDQVLGCVGYGVLAFMCTIYLGTHIASGKAAHIARYHPVVALVVKGFPFLFAYTAAFLGIPVCRWLRLSRANRQMQQRNAWRDEQAAKLARPGQRLLNRLKGAAKWAMNRRSFGDVVYDTSEDFSAREARSGEDDFKAFDGRLEGRR